jgi:hypothetical protein
MLTGGLSPLPFTIVRILATGQTIPPVGQGCVFLLVQDNGVSVCRLVDDPDFGFSMEHPRNDGVLAVLARKAVEANCPQYLASADAVVVICPEEIAKTAEWNL